MRKGIDNFLFVWYNENEPERNANDRKDELHWDLMNTPTGARRMYVF